MHFVERLLKYIGKLFIVFLLILAFMWFLVWSEARRDSRKTQKCLDEILPPLNNILAEKYSPSDYYIEHAGLDVKDERVFHVHVVVSGQRSTTDSFFKESYKIVQMVSEYAKQHPNQFTLNTEEKFELTFDVEKYYTNQFSLLKFTNLNSYYAGWKHETVYEYCDELVDVMVYNVSNIKGLSLFENIQRIDLDTSISDYEELVEEVLRIPNLKYIDMGNGDELALKEKKKYAAELHENGVNSSLWESLYG